MTDKQKQVEACYYAARQAFESLTFLINDIMDENKSLKDKNKLLIVQKRSDVELVIADVNKLRSIIDDYEKRINELREMEKNLKWVGMTKALEIMTKNNTEGVYI